MTTLNHLLNVEVGASFGEPRQPGDPDHILWTTRKLGDIAQAALEWSHRVRRARVHEPFTRAGNEMSAFADDVVEQIVAFPSDKLAQIEEALLTPLGAPSRTMMWTLTISLSNLQPFMEALDEARAHYER